MPPNTVAQYFEHKVWFILITCLIIRQFVRTLSIKSDHAINVCRRGEWKYGTR